MSYKMSTLLLTSEVISTVCIRSKHNI